VLFFVLAIFQIVPLFNPLKSYEREGTIAGRVSGVSTGVPEFINGFNAHIKKMNLTSRVNNIVALIGYLLATITSIATYFTN